MQKNTDSRVQSPNGNKMQNDDTEYNMYKKKLSRMKYDDYNKYDNLIDKIRKSDISGINRIIEDGIDLNNDHGHINNAIGVAIEQNNYTIVKILLENGINPNDEILLGPVENYCTPLIYAVFKNFREITELLLEHGVSTYNSPDYNTTLLFYSAKNNYTNIIKKILNENENIYHLSDALFIAKNNGHKEVVELIKAFIIQEIPLPIPDDIIIDIFMHY